MIVTGQNITYYNHETHPTWAEKYSSKHSGNGKTNGAYTYSCDITKFYFPQIERAIQKSEYKNIVVNSVAMIPTEYIYADTDLVIQFLHESFDRELPRIQKFVSKYKGRVIFITCKKVIEKEILRAGFECICIPPAIDAKAFEAYKRPRKHRGKRVIYFGNSYLGKDKTFQKVRDSFISRGWKFDYISENRLNGGNIISREEVFRTISRYRYGIGVGRCVLEMNALGLRTITSGAEFCGMFTNEEEFYLQKMQNFSIGMPTFSCHIEECIDNFDSAIVKTIDAEEVAPILYERLCQCLI